MDLHDTEHTVEGALVLVPADTVAAHWLGGFKEGVSFALKNCRNCETSGNTLTTKCLDTQCSERTYEVHVERCKQLDTLSKKARTYWSKMWGINDTSCLMQVKDFLLIDGLVQDPMHVLLDGVVRHELAHLLSRFVYTKLLYTGMAEYSISWFPYSYLHSSTKPEPLEKKQIDGTASIKQTSSANLTMI